MKYNSILMQFVTEENAKEREQEKLKEESGINGQDIVLKTRSAGDYAVTLLHCIGYAVFIALIFIGLITILNFDSRQVIVEIFNIFLS